MQTESVAAVIKAFNLYELKSQWSITEFHVHVAKVCVCLHNFEEFLNEMKGLGS